MRLFQKKHYFFNSQLHKIRRQQPTNYLSVFDHFVGLALKELNKIQRTSIQSGQVRSICQCLVHFNSFMMEVLITKKPVH